MAGPYTTELDALRNVIAGDLNTDKLNVSPDASPIAQDRTVSGTLSNAGDSVTVSTIGLSTVMAVITGSWTGNITFEGSLDGSTFPISVAGVDTELLNGQIPVNTAINGKFKFDVTGLSAFRMHNGTSLSGTATVVLRAAQGAGMITMILDTVYTNVGNTVTTTNSALALAQASTTSGQTGPLVQTATTTAAPSYITAKTNPLSTNTSGELRAVLSTNSSLAANQSVNVAQINGVAPLMGAGNTGTGSPRVTIATDQAILTNAWKSNTAQINGVTPLMGNGITGTGSQRVTIASDNTINTNSYSNRSDTYTSTASGTTVDVSAKPMSSFSIAVKSTGSVASVWDMRLEGSLDNVNFTQILQHTNTTGDGVTLFTGSSLAPCLYFRSRCAGITLGLATNIVVTILGMT